MINEETKQKIIDWAKAEPNIVKVYVFGSRARNDYRPDSDLDIAVEIVKDAGDENELGTWIWIAEKLKKRLEKAVPEYQIDLQWSHEEYSKVVYGGVQKSSYLLYERNIT
jgi:uncharacterized protein